MRIPKQVVAVSVLLLITGCAPSSSPKNSEASWAKGTFDGISCEVRGYGGKSSSFAGKDYNELTAGENILRLQAGHVTANGKDLGEVKSGDVVLVDSDGTVSINGKAK